MADSDPARMDSEEDFVARYRDEGYTHDFVATEEGLACPDCDSVMDPAKAHVDDTSRHEGATNPGDESAVYAISNGPCGHQGVLVAAFGPAASPEEADVVRTLGTAPELPADDPVTAREAAEQALIVEGDSDAGAHLGDQID